MVNTLVSLYSAKVSVRRNIACITQVAQKSRELCEKIRSPTGGFLVGWLICFVYSD